MEKNGTDDNGVPSWAWILFALLAFIGWQLYVANSHSSDPSSRTIIVVTPTSEEKELDSYEKLQRSIEVELRD